MSMCQLFLEGPILFHPTETTQPVFIRAHGVAGCNASLKHQQGSTKHYERNDLLQNMTSNGKKKKKSSSSCFFGFEWWSSRRRSLAGRDPTQKWEMWQSRFQPAQKHVSILKAELSIEPLLLEQDMKGELAGRTCFLPPQNLFEKLWNLSMLYFMKMSSGHVFKRPLSITRAHTDSMRSWGRQPE